MTATSTEQLVQSLMYEGYALYPYRASAVKNKQRWTFGCLLPRTYCEARLLNLNRAGSDDYRMQLQCLVIGSDETTVEMSVRFLHVMNRSIGEPAADGRQHSELPSLPPGFRRVDELEIDGRQHRTWQEAVEREVVFELTWSEQRKHRSFEFPQFHDCRILHNRAGKIAGASVREQQPIRGIIDASAEPLGNGLFKLSILVTNQTDYEAAAVCSRSDAILSSLVSTHVMLRARSGEFVSLLDPPDECREAVSRCENRGGWPVLVGSKGSRDTMLASPIILYDYPQIAPESPGNLFDGTEIDEILSLRIQTLTDDEKREAASVDQRVRELLQRTHDLPENHLVDLHGRATFRPARFAIEKGSPGDEQKWRAGDRVRLRPRGRADAMDMILDGRSATVQSVEQDFEDNLYVTVTIDDDPGRDLGADGQPGHRFFFRCDEVEPIAATE